MRVIIFEGLDKVGKTTTILKLKKVIEEQGKIPIIFNTPYQIKCNCANDVATKLNISMLVLKQMFEEYDDNYICLIDRFHLSEMVFGPRLRNGYDLTTCIKIDDFLAHHSVFLVYIKPDSLNENFDKFKDENGKLDGFGRIEYKSLAYFFNKAYRWTKIKKTFITTSEIDSSLLRLLKFKGVFKWKR